MRRLSHSIERARAGVLVLAVAISFPTIASGQSEPLTDSARVAGWRSDIAFYLDQLRHRHYVYRSKPLPPALIRAASVLSDDVPRYSDERMLAELEHLASFAGDGHTYMLPFGSSRIPSHMLPLRMFMFDDGLYVIDAFPGYEQWIGSRIVRIGDTPGETVVGRMRPDLSADNRYGYLWVGPPLLSFQGYLERFSGITRTDSIPLTLRLPGKRDTSLSIAPILAPPLRGIPKLVASKVAGAASAPLYLTNLTDNFWFKELPAEKTLYVQFNQVMNSEKESLAQFAGRLDTEISAMRPRTLIVDARHNNGGNLGLLPPLLDVFRKYESIPNGRIYVLMGRNTFSAAQVFLAQMDRYTKAIFAGEPSSSRPNFVGEESPVMLPWSKAIGSISDQYHETIPGDKREWIEPTIKLVPRSKDYFANRDPLLQKVLADAARRR